MADEVDVNKRFRDRVDLIFHIVEHVLVVGAVMFLAKAVDSLTLKFAAGTLMILVSVEISLALHSAQFFKPTGTDASTWRRFGQIALDLIVFGVAFYFISTCFQMVIKAMSDGIGV